MGGRDMSLIVEDGTGLGATQYLLQRPLATFSI